MGGLHANFRYYAGPVYAWPRLRSSREVKDMRWIVSKDGRTVGGITASRRTAEALRDAGFQVLPA